MNMPTLTKILLCQRGGNYQLEQDGAYISYDSRTGSGHKYHEYFKYISIVLYYVLVITRASWPPPHEEG